MIYHIFEKEHLISTVKAFKTPPATITNTYTYTFTEHDIRRSDGYRLVISRGKLMPSHFSAIHRMLYAADIIRSGLTIEAQSVQRGPRSRVKPAALEDGAELVPLHVAVGMLETQLEVITANVAVPILPSRSNDEAMLAPWRRHDFRFRYHAERIAPLLDDLHTGNWYGNPASTHVSGFSSIETIGGKLFGLLLDLIWELDNASEISIVPTTENKAPEKSSPSPAASTSKKPLDAPRSLKVLACEEEIEDALGRLMGADDLSDMADLVELGSDFDRFSVPR